MPRKKKTDGDLVPFIVADDEKSFEAHKLRLQGQSWEVIAKEVGFSSAAVASVETYRYLSKLTVLVSKERREESLTMELARLDELQASVWASAVSGDLNAIDRVLKIMQHRAKLIGLDLTIERTTSTTIVVNGNSHDYITSLRIASGEIVEGEEVG